MASLALIHVACGGGGSGAQPRRAADAGPQPDLGSMVSGTALVTGDLDLFGVTTGDVAAVQDRSGRALAVPVSGEPVQPVAEASDLVGVAGPAIFSFSNADLVSGIGDLTIWTPAGGAVAFASGAAFVVAVSDDGSHALATAHTSSDATSTNLVLGVLDGTGTAPRTLASIALTGACSPKMLFVAGRFVVSACPADSEVPTISSVDPGDGTMTTLLAGARPSITAVPQAAAVALVDQSGSAILAPVAGGTPRPIGEAVDQIVSAAEGSALILRQQGTISVVPVAGGDPVGLGGTGFVDVAAVSADGQNVLFQQKEGLKLGYGDLWLASATSAQSPRQLSTDLNTAIFHTAFSADGLWALYFTGSDLYGVGTFTVAPIAGGAPSVLGTGGWTVLATTDAKIIYTDAYEPVAKRPGRAVLRSVDLSTDAAPSILATYAGAYVYLTQARDRIVYSFNDGSAQSGLYAAHVP